MEEFLLIDDNEIKLNSGLDEYMFGKTKYSSVVNQKGILFDGENFTEWAFDDVKSQKIDGKEELQVFYCGKNPLSKNAKTLLACFESENRDEMFTAAMKVCTALTNAAKKDFPLPINGAGGILVDDSSLLFLPSDLFKYSLACLTPKLQATSRGCWINETLTGLPATSFFRATIAYTMLTGQFPFPSTDPVERNADILDRKFLPLEMRLPTVNPALATEINKALKLTSSAVNLPGKKQKGKSSEDLTPTADFPLDLLEKEKENIPPKEQQEEQEQKIQNYIKMRDSKIKTKRAIRRNTAAILAFAILAFIIGFIVRESVKSHLTDYTTQTLTSTQTIQAFMQTINKKEATMLVNFTKGRKASKYTDTVSQVYVMSKQRQSTAGDNGFACPENYFIYVTDAYKNQTSGLYGLTHLKIDDIEYEMNIEIPTFGQNLPPLQEENGFPLTKGTIATHKAEYYLLHTEGENSDIYVDYVTEIYTLIFKKGRWFIIDIDTTAQEIDINSTKFKLEYFDLLKEVDYDIPAAVERMSFQYPWVPSKASIIREQARIQRDLIDPFLGIFN